MLIRKEFLFITYLYLSERDAIVALKLLKDSGVIGISQILIGNQALNHIMSGFEYD